ncbi:MAG TPA: HAD-IIA family hydrolase [Fimbriimonadaceae bacterium]|nr:HAD-IIA family hydrolase [Fimbriimonadaceae bacterium]
MSQAPIRLVIFDLDGTLYRGSEPTPHAASALVRLREARIAVRAFTNNSGATAQDLSHKLTSMGLPFGEDEVLGTGMLAADLCLARGWSEVLAIGEPGLHACLTEAGVDSQSARPQAVIAGICRSLTYGLLDRGLQALVGDASFVATNRDATYPLEQGRIEPGAGAIVAALEACSGIEPYVLGKPSPDGVTALIRGAEVSPTETVVVGDRLDTDLAAAVHAGARGLLVLTGVTSSAPAGIDAITDLGALPAWIERA